MKRWMIMAMSALALHAFTVSGAAYGQAVFKMAFKFEAGDNKLPAGEYRVELKEEGKISLRREATGDEVTIPIIEKLPPPDAALEAPRLIFDMVANFEPSYTEYVTDYLLAEVWLTGKEGFLMLAGERSEYNQAVEGTAAKK